VSSVVDVQAYGVVNARVRARYSTMLDEAVWDALYRAEDFDAVLGILGVNAYAPYLVIDRAELTPRRAVYQIKKHLAEAYDLAIQYTPQPGRELIVQLRRLFEVDNLKAVLRGVETGATWSEVRYVLFPLGRSTVLPAEDMLRAKDMRSAIDLLQGTPYYTTLSHALQRYTAEQSLFPLEVALDLDYVRALWDDINCLAEPDHTQALRIVGTQIDITNLMWAIRYRVYHNLSEEEIINYTVPFGYRVHDNDIRAIAGGGDIAKVVQRIYPDITDVEQLLQEPRKGLPELEVRLQRHLARRCRAAFIGYPFQVGIPVAYVLLNELEIQDLTVMIEAKAVKMPIEEFEPYLVIGHVRE